MSCGLPRPAASSAASARTRPRCLPLADAGQQVAQVVQADRQRLALAELALDHQRLLEQVPGPGQVAVVHLQQGHVVQRGGQGAAVTEARPQFHGAWRSCAGPRAGRPGSGTPSRARSPRSRCGRAHPAARGCAAPAGPGGSPRRSRRSRRPEWPPSRTRARPARPAAGPPGPAASPASPGRAAGRVCSHQRHSAAPISRPRSVSPCSCDQSSAWCRSAVAASSRAFHSAASGPARPVSLPWASAAKCARVPPAHLGRRCRTPPAGPPAKARIVSSMLNRLCSPPRVTASQDESTRPRIRWGSAGPAPLTARRVRQGERPGEHAEHGEQPLLLRPEQVVAGRITSASRRPSAAAAPGESSRAAPRAAAGSPAPTACRPSPRSARWPAAARPAGGTARRSRAVARPRR